MEQQDLEKAVERLTEFIKVAEDPELSRKRDEERRQEIIEFGIPLDD